MWLSGFNRQLTTEFATLKDNFQSYIKLLCMNPTELVIVFQGKSLKIHSFFKQQVISTIIPVQPLRFSYRES